MYLFDGAPIKNGEKRVCVFVSYVYDVNVYLYPFYVHFPDIQTPTGGWGMQSHSSTDNLW